MNASGRGALERSYGASLEPLAQLVNALGSVGAFACLVEAAEVVATQAAKLGRRVSVGADTKASVWVTAHPRRVIFVSLRTAASVVMPSSPMPLVSRLQARGRMETVRE